MVSKFAPALITTAVAVAISASVCVYLLKKKRRHDKIPTEWQQIGIAKKLYIFPLKSGHYVEIDSVECTEVGFRLMKSVKNLLQLRDRSFTVYNEKDREIKSGRHIPALVTIEVSVHDEHHIAFDAPQMRTLYVRIPEKNDGNEVSLNFLGNEIEAVDCGDEAARWLSQHLIQKDSGYRLGYHDASKRNELGKYGEKLKYYKNLTDAATGLFSDLTSLMIVNQASVNDYLKKAPGANVVPIIFRGNIIIDGPDVEPYAEDHWDWMKIGEDVIIRNVKECTRCIFTLVDPETGTRNSDREPLTTLSTYRMSKGPEKAPVMGIHMDVRKTGTIKCGDPVYIGVQ